MQEHILILVIFATILCDVKKTKCMVANSLDKIKIVSNSFPQFSIIGQFVDEFRCFGH